MAIFRPLYVQRKCVAKKTKEEPVCDKNHLIRSHGYDRM